MYYALIGQVYQEFPRGFIVPFACKGKTVSEVLLDYFRQTDWEVRVRECMVLPVPEMNRRYDLYNKCRDGERIPLSFLKSWRSDIVTETSATIAVSKTRPVWYQPKANDNTHITESKEFLDFQVKEYERLENEDLKKSSKGS